MSEAPERVYLDGDVEAGDGMFPRCFENPKYASEPPVEYIRADRVTAMLKAEREKALREAADKLGNLHDGFTYRPRDMKRHVLQMIEKDATDG